MDNLNNVYSALKTILGSDISKSDDCYGYGYGFNAKHSFEQRKIMSTSIKNKYPDRVHFKFVKTQSAHFQ